MKSKPVQIVQYILLLAAGAGLCFLFFKDFDLHVLSEKISAGNLFWFYIVMIVSLGVYVVRTLRWQMLINAMGYKASFGNAFSALSIGYFINFFFPRLGEITRCLSIKKQHEIPFMQLIGTVIIERVIDIVSLMIMLLLTLLLQFHQIVEFMKENIFRPIYHGLVLKIINGNTMVLVIALSVFSIVIFLFFYFKRYIRERSPKFVVQFVEGLKQGLASIAKLKQKKLFILYTFLIWLGYYLMTYFWFFVFKETSVLTWGACLAIVTIGTVGRSVPIQGGGLGAYHFLVTSVIVLYGLTEEWGKTIATLIHLGQTVFTFAMGLVGLIIFFVSYWRRRQV